MSGNLMASPLMTSHAPVNREPPLPPSDARGQGAGFESLLAEFDPPNPAAPAAKGEKGPAPQTARAAPSADPSALTSARAALMTNIDAAMSSLAMGAALTPGPSAPTTPHNAPKAVARPGAGSSALMLAAVKPSTTPARQTAGANGASAPTLAEAADEGAPEEATPNPTPTAELVPGGAAPATAFAPPPRSSKHERASPAPTEWPSGSKPNPNVSDIESFSAAAIRRAGAMTADVSATPNPAPTAESVRGGPASATTVVATPTASATAVGAPTAPTFSTDSAAPSPWPSASKANASVAEIGPLLSTATPRASARETIPENGSTLAADSKTPTPWPSAAKPNASVAEIGSLLSTSIARAGEATPGAIGTRSLNGGSGLDAGSAPGAAAGTISYATQIALSFAPELGFQGLQTKTHLAVPSAANAGSVGGRGSAHGNAAASALAAPSVAPLEQVNPRGERSSSPNRGRDGPDAAAPQADAAKAPNAAPTMVSSVSSSPPALSSPNANAVHLSDLGDRLASEARSLARPDAETGAKPASLPIKELHLDLQPANLGAVAIKLKMTDGKLSVDVGVANPNALAAVEGQRDSIVSKLQVGAQTLESFVVHQQAFADPFSAQSSPNPSLTGSSGNTSGHEQFSRDGREQTPRQQPTPPTDDAPPARNGLRTGLVV